VSRSDAVPRPPGPPPPGRNPLAFAAFLRAFGRDPLGFVEGRFATYGDTYFTVSRGAPLYVTRDPRIVKDVLVHRAASFEKRNEDLASFLGNGLLNANGDRWRRQRRRIQPAFHRDRLRGYAEVFGKRAEGWCQRHAAGDVIDLEREMTALTLEIVCETLFDHDVEGRALELGRTIDRIQEGLNLLLPEWLPTPGRVKQIFATRRLHRTLDELIESKRSKPGPDLISRLLEVVDDEGHMSNEQLRDEVVTLFAAGHETTALALTWTLFHLARNPGARDRLQVEVDAVSGSRASSDAIGFDA